MSHVRSFTYWYNFERKKMASSSICSRSSSGTLLCNKYFTTCTVELNVNKTPTDLSFVFTLWSILINISIFHWHTSGIVRCMLHYYILWIPIFMSSMKIYILFHLLCVLECAFVWKPLDTFIRCLLSFYVWNGVSKLVCKSMHLAVMSDQQVNEWFMNKCWQVAHQGLSNA